MTARLQSIVKVDILIPGRQNYLATQWVRVAGGPGGLDCRAMRAPSNTPSSKVRLLRLLPAL